VLGILWTRLNGKGAISCLLTGFVMGALRFVLEVLDKGAHYESPAVRWLLDMNFLHYAIFMFVVCSAVLVVVSLATPAPDRRKLAGLTFATVNEKVETTDVTLRTVALRRETPFEHKLNVAFSLLLVATVLYLWIHFR
jgi:SSS family solute:Na+ symporter